jgi:hypothetical protein
LWDGSELTAVYYISLFLRHLSQRRIPRSTAPINVHFPPYYENPTFQTLISNDLKKLVMGEMVQTVYAHMNK